MLWHRKGWLFEVIFMICLLIYNDLSRKQQRRLKRERERGGGDTTQMSDMKLWHQRHKTHAAALGSSGLVSASGMSSADLCEAIFFSPSEALQISFSSRYVWFWAASFLATLQFVCYGMKNPLHRYCCLSWCMCRYWERWVHAFFPADWCVYCLNCVLSFCLPGWKIVLKLTKTYDIYSRIKKELYDIKHESLFYRAVIASQFSFKNQHFKLTRIYCKFFFNSSETDNCAPSSPKVAVKPLPLDVRLLMSEGERLIYSDVSKQTTDRYDLIQPWCLPAVWCGAIWYNPVQFDAILWTFSF